ncbi:MAG: cobalamin-binding protein [Desulfobacterales bacterium]|nr:cobalamin-binding protein [Desulfobacterales bacterium]
MAVKDIVSAVLAFNAVEVVDLVNTEIKTDTGVEEILNTGLIGAMDIVGQRFSDGDLFVPEMLMAAQAMKAGLAVLKPHLSSESVVSRGTVVIGTVKGDLHDIGKNLVAMLMEGGGFNVVDLGVDIDAKQFVDAAVEHKADVVALSALLTTTMPAMEAIIGAIKKSGINTRIIIGGAPVTAVFASQVGADGYSQDAPGAVEQARALMAG